MLSYKHKTTSSPPLWRNHNYLLLQGGQKEALGGLGIPCRTQEKLQGVPFRIDRPVEIHPHFLHFNVLSSTLQESLQAFR
jgi:hypothetical protein